MSAVELTEEILEQRQAAVADRAATLVSALAHIADSSTRADPEKIARRVCTETGFSLAILRGPLRTKSVRTARKLLYRALRASGMSYPEIGAFCNRDHTTVLVGCK